MFAVFFNSATPPYAIGYEVMDVVEYNKKYAHRTDMIFVSNSTLSGNALTRFIGQFQKYYLQNGQLVYDTTK